MGDAPSGVVARRTCPFGVASGLPGGAVWGGAGGGAAALGQGC